MTHPPQQAIIFVPGFKGSTLARGDKEIWLTARQALFGDETLTLPLDPQSRGDLRATGVFKKVAILSPILQYNVYGNFVAWLKKRFPDRSVSEFAYDWRRDNYENVKGLHDEVERLRKDGIKSFTFIAHSMGGLITAYYLRYGVQPPEATGKVWADTQDFHAAIFAGSPFKGALETLHDFHYGELTGWNKTLLSSAALSTFPSMYQLLPAPTVKAVKAKEPVDLFTPEFWAENSWGIMNGESTQPREVRAAFLQEQLGRAAEIFRLLHDGAGPAHPSSLKVLNIRGHGSLTPAEVSWLPRHTDSEDSYNASLHYDDGDGVVTWTSAELPPAFRQHAPAEIRTESTHQFLYDDKEVRKAVEHFLRNTSGPAAQK